MARKSFDIPNFDKEIENYKYVYVFISTDFTNAQSRAIEVEAFDDVSEIVGMDEDEIARLMEMSAGNTDFNDTYWTIVCVKDGGNYDNIG